MEWFEFLRNTFLKLISMHSTYKKGIHIEANTYLRFKIFIRSLKSWWIEWLLIIRGYVAIWTSANLYREPEVIVFYDKSRFLFGINPVFNVSYGGDFHGSPCRNWTMDRSSFTPSVNSSSDNLSSEFLSIRLKMTSVLSSGVILLCFVFDDESTILLIAWNSKT